MALTTITMRIDEDLKAELQSLLSDLGLDMTTYFVMAAHQAVREQGLPFMVSKTSKNHEKMLIERILAYKKLYTEEAEEK